MGTPTQGQCVYVSRDGLAGLKREHEEIEVELASKTKEMGEVARADPDLPENTYFKMLRVDVHMKYPQRLRELKRLIDGACLIEESPTYQNLPEGHVWLGCRVRLFDVDLSEHEEWLILGEREGDVERMIISHLSPFGAELLGKKSGEELHFRGRHLRIESVEKALG